MPKHLAVDDRDVDDREGREQASQHGEEEEFVLPDGVDDGEGAGLLFGVHVEQAAGQVLRLQGHDREQDGEDAVRRAASAVRQITRLIEALVAVVTQIAIADTVGDDDVGHETEDAHESAVDELVDDELLGEDAGFEAVRRAGHDVRAGFFQAQADGEEGGRDQVGPQDFDGGEREDGALVAILEGEADEEEDDLRNVRDEQVEQEL